MLQQEYQSFLESKVSLAQSRGLAIGECNVNPLCKPHQRDIIRWAVHKGRAAIFAAFGLGKSFIQLEVARLITGHTSKPFLIVAPLGVRQEFTRDAAKLGIEIRFIRRTEDVDPAWSGIYLTNYESVRDGRLDVSLFAGVSLDEASVLRGFGGTKTFREFMRVFEELEYRFVATATPSPNDFIELLAYAAFLGVMDVGQAKTRFFARNSEKADQLTLLPHKEREFWLWVSSWAVFLQRPSDLGYSDEGYELPEMEVRWHELPVVSNQSSVISSEPGGQGRLLPNSGAIGLAEAAREKRESLDARLEKLLELRALAPAAHRLIWHDLEAERRAVEKALGGDCEHPSLDGIDDTPDGPEKVWECKSCFGHYRCVYQGDSAFRYVEVKRPFASVYGTQDLEEREQAIIDFSEGRIAELAAKPVIAGSGCNFQRHCWWAIFFGIGFKFNDFIQAVHRIQRFQQTHKVRIDLIYTEAERPVREILERKWRQHEELTAKMTEIIREYGLAGDALKKELQRSIGVERLEESGRSFRVVRNDTVLETSQTDSESAHLIMTSIPFSTQYEYTPSFNDFGHSESNTQFFEQMDFLTPHLLRVLKPGRVAAIHVKDRIVPGGMSGLGFQTVYPFSDEVVRHFTRHGFAFLARKTIVTDVVRENNQTYRLGWTEQCKDGSRMGAGMPEYLLLFRKPQTDRSKGYADEPVLKDKADYSRSRWQIDAHGFMRSSGNRLLTPAELDGQPHERIFKMFREYSLGQVYDYEQHVALSESLETCAECADIHVAEGGKCACGCSGAGRLPVTFMLMQPQSWHPDVWTDITRMLSLNSVQAAKKQEKHLCPLQFDIVDRVIRQFSMPGETVFDPFGGLMTVPYRAVLLGRYGVGVELNANYFRDGVDYCRAAEAKAAIPSLFEMESCEAAEPRSLEDEPLNELQDAELVEGVLA